MRLLNVFLATMLVLITLSAAAAEELDGFRGLKWGSDLAALRSYGQQSVEGHMGAVSGVEAYRLKNEDLNIGGIKANGIVYAFFKGRFTSVSIDYGGFDNYEKLLAYCKGVFGPVTGSASMKLEHYVSFDSPRTGAILLYQLSLPSASYGRLYLYSKEFLQ
jgi:hypothetical protein